MKWAYVAVGAVLALVSSAVVSAQYPTGVKSFVTRTAGQTIQPAHINDLQTEVAAVETGLLTGLAHDLLPLSDSLYDLGSTGVRWAEVWTDALTITNNLSVGGTFDLTGILTLANTALHLLDTNASHDLILAPGSDLTADRTLSLVTGDAARTITLTGNPTLADWFNQGVRTSDAPTFMSMTLSGATTLGIRFRSTGSVAPPVASNVYDAYLDSTLVPQPDVLAIGMRLIHSITEAASGTHVMLAGLYVDAPTITGGAAAVTNTASVYIANQPSATVTGANYALWVDNGATALDGNTTVGGTLSVTGATTLSSTATLNALTQFGASSAVSGTLTTPGNLTCDSATKDTLTIGNVTFIRVTTAGVGNCIVKGITAPTTGTGGRMLIVLNATGQVIVFNDEDASETTAANRIATAGTTNSITVDNLGIFVYDPTTQRWRPIGQTVA